MEEIFWFCPGLSLTRHVILGKSFPHLWNEIDNHCSALLAGLLQKEQMKCYIKKPSTEGFPLLWFLLTYMGTQIFYFLVYITMESISLHRMSLRFCAIDVSRALRSTGITAWLGWSVGNFSKQTHCAFAFLQFFTKWPWIHVSLPHTHPHIRLTRILLSAQFSALLELSSSSFFWRDFYKIIVFQELL